MRKALLIAVVLLAGCSGSEDKATTAPDSATVLKRTGDHLATTLRQAARVLDRESCADEEQIRSLSTDVNGDLFKLDKLKDDPALASERPQIVDGIETASGVRDGLEELLVAC